MARRHGRRTGVALLAAGALLVGTAGAQGQGLVATAALPRSSSEAQGLSSSAVLAFLEAADTQIDQMNSFMLVRHGHVVAEGWWRPYDAATPHVLYSLSKSFTATAVGLAVAEGRFGLDDPVLKFFPEDAPQEPSANLKAMRVRDLLRMVTGHDKEAPLWRDDSETRDLPWARKYLAHPVPFKPGTHFLYNSPATYMLSAIVQKTSGETVLAYLGPRLFEPLGFESPSWVASPEGVTVGAYGFFARTEEIARFGQLYLQKGAWNGKRLLPAAFVEEATARQTSNGSAPTSDWDQGYGYQFWRSRHGYRADGAFGQYCLVLPELDAVVAITSGVPRMQAVMDLVWEKLLPAMGREALPEDAARARALAAKLASLTVPVPAGRPTVPLARQVSGRSFVLAPNDRGLRTIALDFAGSSAELTVRTVDGVKRTPIGLGSWVRSEGFANGIDRFLAVPVQPRMAASGAWTADDTFTVKLVAYETPFYATLALKFSGDELLLDSRYNVAFGPTTRPALLGRAENPVRGPR